MDKPKQDIASLSNRYPLLHEHVKLPGVLVQVCPQGDVKHSLMSKVKYCI